jgi:succinoglycan biosynthesis transport protein ExoP
MNNEYHEINLMEIILLVLKRWYIIFVLAIIGATLAYYVTTNYVQPVYQANAKLFIGREKNSIAGLSISYAELQTYNQLLYDYQQIAQTRYVIEKVISNLNLNMSVGAFRSSLGVSTIEGARLFIVSFKSTNRELARDAANELAEQLMIAVSDIFSVENIQIIDEALLPEYPISPNKFKNTIIAGIIGMIIGVLAIFIYELFNNTFKKESDVEKELGIPVIGIIPKFKGEKRI